MSRVHAGAVGTVSSLAFTVCALAAPALAFVLAVPFTIALGLLLSSDPRPRHRRRPHA